ncbi:hypothetical protein JCM17845_10620 [Iodidimonas gelatinilytica]|uniref:Uncharacterized protein n=1 Tax=Iodidimonas gelatinilytica TaxID=1236966 RepID=A0A5A7MZP9_9PROT|nr:hypothetical protein JCM17845_10620 [Iodidimonas gelatinilytica]
MIIGRSPRQQFVPRNACDLKREAERLFLIGEVFAHTGLKAPQRLRAMPRVTRETWANTRVQLGNAVNKGVQRLRRE